MFWCCQNPACADLPDTPQKIGDSAFARCLALEGINLPEGLEELGSEAFAVCGRLRRVESPRADGIRPTAAARRRRDGVRFQAPHAPTYGEQRNSMQKSLVFFPPACYNRIHPKA